MIKQNITQDIIMNYIKTTEKFAKESNILIVSSPFERIERNSGFLELNEERSLIQMAAEITDHVTTLPTLEQFLNFLYSSFDIRLRPTFVYSHIQTHNSIMRRSVIPSFCEMYNLHSLTPDASTLSFTTEKYNIINTLQVHNISVPTTFIAYNAEDFLKDKTEYYVKKSDTSSSFEVVKRTTEQTRAFIQTLRNPFSYVIQEAVYGIEVEVSAIYDGTKVTTLPPMQLNTEELTHDDVNHQNYTYDVFTDALKTELEETTKKVVVILNTFGISRVDFIVDLKTKKYYVIDIAALPILVEKSSTKQALETVFEGQAINIMKLLIGIKIQQLKKESPY